MRAARTLEAVQSSGLGAALRGAQLGHRRHDATVSNALQCDAGLCSRSSHSQIQGPTVPPNLRLRGCAEGADVLAFEGRGRGTGKQVGRVPDTLVPSKCDEPFRGRVVGAEIGGNCLVYLPGPTTTAAPLFLRPRFPSCCCLLPFLNTSTGSRAAAGSAAADQHAPSASSAWSPLYVFR